MAPEGGNTKTPSGSMKMARIAGAKRWPFTWNNYPENWLQKIEVGLKGANWIGVPEVGESGTPHIQGYVEFPIKVRPIGYMGMPKEIHWGDENGKSARGTREDNVAYCTKNGSEGKEGNLRVPRPLKLLHADSLYEWQKEIIQIISGEPCDRKIYWYWGETNIGKTTFAKYLSAKYGAIPLSGKAADMKNGVVQYKQASGETPELIIIPIPKTFNYEYISYEGIEQIKDMYFYSGKYEGGVIVGNCPHIIVFANQEPPNMEALATDRWVIRQIV